LGSRHAFGLFGPHWHKYVNVSMCLLAGPRRSGRPPRQRAACHAAFARRVRARPPEPFFVEATTGNRRSVRRPSRNTCAPAPASITDLAHVLAESHRPDRGGRLLRRPTATYRLLFVVVLLAHDRRRIRRVAVTAHLTAAWTARQLREAFPWDQAPQYLIHLTLSEGRHRRYPLTWCLL
jgi:hypothetical protein